MLTADRIIALSKLLPSNRPLYDAVLEDSNPNSREEIIKAILSDNLRYFTLVQVLMSITSND